jgi:hypothetical protein
MTNSIAIILPIYKEHLDVNEEIGYAQLKKHLGQFKIICVAPRHVDIPIRDFEIKKFDDEYFTSTDTYSKLLLSSSFYKTFEGFQYILIYQLDCLIFSDQLLAWCKEGYDYIGAPWFNSPSNPSKGFSRVGNGGFSLRKVRSFLRVLDADGYIEDPDSFSHFWRSNQFTDLHDWPAVTRLAKIMRIYREIRRGVHWYSQHYTLNEDHFWSDRARFFYPEFTIAPTEKALAFSFERFPEYCFEQNQRKLPFGCHAWAKWNRAFWEPFLLKE